MKPADLLLALCLHFAGLSLFAFGGASVVVPEMFRIAVTQEHWMSATEFTYLFAIGQAAPGPNVLIVTLIGWHVAGVSGALLATLAFCLPGGLLACAVAGVWQRFRDAPWRARIQRGLVPLTVGLVSATAWVLAHSASPGFGAVGLALACAVVASRNTLNPLWLLAAGAVLGVFGVV